MYFLKSPLKSWLSACLFLSIFCSCEMDNQLLPLKNVSGQELVIEDEDLQNQNDSARLRVGNIIYEETFEGSNPLSQYVFKQLPESHSFRVASSPALGGQKSGRFELRKGDRVVTSSGVRAELLFQQELLKQIIGNE